MVAVGAPDSPGNPSKLNLPNAITLSGYAMTIAWLMGASPWWAVGGLLADEVDGRVARATGTTSEFGGLLDWGVDLTLTGVVMERAGLLPWLPVVTTGQVYLKEKGFRPSIGSARAVATLYELWKSKFRPLKGPLNR